MSRSFLPARATAPASTPNYMPVVYLRFQTGVEGRFFAGGAGKGMVGRLVGPSSLPIEFN
jgi:hypothetical protein